MSRPTGSQIIAILKQVEAGAPIPEQPEPLRHGPRRPIYTGKTYRGKTHQLAGSRHIASSAARLSRLTLCLLTPCVTLFMGLLLGAFALVDKDSHLYQTG